MSLKEDNIPVDKKGQPDLSRYTDSVEYYAEMYEKFISSLDGNWPWVTQETNLPFRTRVHATWGLISKGAAAIPYSLKMLQHSKPDVREDGSSILGSVGKSDSVVRNIIAALRAERDTTARDSMISALGELHNRLAIPILAEIIRDDSEDGDTRWTAVESIGKIVRKRFLAQSNPIEAAIDWLRKHDPNAD
jgi:HEAT repeat protein